MPSRRYRSVTPEVRAAAVEQVHSLLQGNPSMSRTEAARTVAADIGHHHNSILNWVRDADASVSPQTVTDLRRKLAHVTAQLKASQKTNRELAEALNQRDENPG